MYTSEQEYLDLLEHVLTKGIRKPNRTGVDCLTVIGAQCRYDLQEGFPLFTTKRVWLKGVVHELLWFLKGKTDIKYLLDNDVHIWDDDAWRWHQEKNIHPKFDTKKEFLEFVKSGEGQQHYPTVGSLGPIYGKQWRYWQGVSNHIPMTPFPAEAINQILKLVDGIKNNPESRRHILTAWNPTDVENCALPPCHVMAIFSVLEGKLHCQMVQRSCDMFLGVPFNVASYSLLTHMIAQVCNLEVGEFIHSLHDIHIYMNHVDAVKEQLSRDLRPLPTLKLNPDIDGIFKFTYDDIKVEGYNPHPAIKADLVT